MIHLKDCRINVYSRLIIVDFFTLDSILDFQVNNNIASICTTVQCQQGLSEKTAMRWIDAHGVRTDYTFSDLEKQSNRFANALTGFGIGKGDIFFTFLPKMPEQFFAFLGTLKIQAVCGTLFSNFGEDALLDRLGDSGAVGIITRKSLYKRLFS